MIDPTSEKEYINRINPVDIEDYRDLNYESKYLPNRSGIYQLHPENFENIDNLNNYNYSNFNNSNQISKSTQIQEDTYLAEKRKDLKNSHYQLSDNCLVNNKTIDNFQKQPQQMKPIKELKQIDDLSKFKASNLVDEFFNDVKNVKTSEVIFRYITFR